MLCRNGATDYELQEQAKVAQYGHGIVRYSSELYVLDCCLASVWAKTNPGHISSYTKLIVYKTFGTELFRANN